MSAGAAIAGALQRCGRQMTLRRSTLGPDSEKIPFDVDVFGAPPANLTAIPLVGSVIQGNEIIVISDIEISAAQWPGPPAGGDELRVDGQWKAIKSCDTKRLGTEILAHFLQVIG